MLSKIKQKVSNFKLVYILDSIIAIVLVFLVIYDSEPKYYLWSCDLMALLLALNLLVLRKLEVYFFIFLITFSSTIEWVFDFFKMLLGFKAPKTMWMLNTDEPLFFTELQHALIMVIPFYYSVLYLKRIQNKQVVKKIKLILFFFIISSLYYLALILISYFLTLYGVYDFSENINCVIRECGSLEGFRSLKELLFYWLHYVLNEIILISIISLFLFKNYLKNVAKTFIKRLLNKI
jgi:hypothetical protein